MSASGIDPPTGGFQSWDADEDDASDRFSSKKQQEIFRDEGDEEYESDRLEMSISELLYSTTAFYSIVVPGE